MMKVYHYREVDPLSVARIEETTQGFTIRRVINEVDGATDFVMDVFEFEPGGYSEPHSHPWEHQVFVVSGEGEIRGAGEVVGFGPGEVIYIERDDEHQFVNTGTEPVLFVCSVPKAALTAYYIDVRPPAED